MQYDLNVNSKRIINVASPQDENDACPKAFTISFTSETSNSAKAYTDLKIQTIPKGGINYSYPGAESYFDY